MRISTGRYTAQHNIDVIKPPLKKISEPDSAPPITPMIKGKVTVIMGKERMMFRIPPPMPRIKPMKTNSPILSRSTSHPLVRPFKISKSSTTIAMLTCSKRRPTNQPTGIKRQTNGIRQNRPIPTVKTVIAINGEIRSRTTMNTTIPARRLKPRILQKKGFPLVNKEPKDNRTAGSPLI